MRKNLRRLVMWSGLCLAAVTAPASAQGDADMNDLVLGDGSQWKLLGEQLREDEAGAIQSPPGRDLHSRAFYTAKAFSDVTVEFDFGHGPDGV